MTASIEMADRLAIREVLENWAIWRDAGDRYPAEEMQNADAALKTLPAYRGLHRSLLRFS
jgi:hypothetical protein